jgi:NAD(P)-dependent dehydrogenase (short-subunit alcohol dehydrogenase family)
MGKLDGKIALVTGGSTGIGLATAKEFVEEGAYVYITGRNETDLNNAVTEIGRNVTGVQGDVSKNSDLDRLYRQIKEEKGQIDVVFANAGVAEFVPVADVTEEHFDKLFAINVRGLFFTVQKALALLKSGASVILNASAVSVKGFEAASVYSATKAAVRSFARTWTTDLKDRNIRVNVLSPGPIETPIMAKLTGGDEAQLDQFKVGITAIVPQGRIGRADEIAKPVVFLASDDSSFISGIELFVDGGVAQV